MEKKIEMLHHQTIKFPCPTKKQFNISGASLNRHSEAHHWANVIFNLLIWKMISVSSWVLTETVLKPIKHSGGKRRICTEVKLTNFVNYCVEKLMFLYPVKAWVNDLNIYVTIVNMCIFFQHTARIKIVLPVWRHACIFELPRVGDLGLVF